MGTDINETIEAKRTLFANNAGQISFASLLIGTRIRGNGDIARVSRDLGFLWILSGQQPGPVVLLDLLQKGTHIVNQSTIIARIFTPCSDVTKPSSLLRENLEHQFLTLLRSSLENLNHQQCNNMCNTELFGVGRTAFPLRFKGFHGFESLSVRVLGGDVKNFLPSTLYSWILLANGMSLTPQRSSVISRRPFPNRSLLCAQPHASRYPIAITHRRQTVSINKRGLPLFLEEGLKGLVGRTAGRSSNTLVWVFPAQYKTITNGIAWLDSRYINQKLNFGELIWVEKNPDKKDLKGSQKKQDKTTFQGSNQFSNKLMMRGRYNARTQKAISPNPLAGRGSITSVERSASTLHTVHTVHSQRLNLVKTSFLLTNASPLKTGYWFNSVTSSEVPHLFSKATSYYSNNFVKKTEKGKRSRQTATYTSLLFVQRRFHCTITKSWIEKNHSFTKENALKLQSDHFGRGFDEALVSLLRFSKENLCLAKTKKDTKGFTHKSTERHKSIQTSKIDRFSKENLNSKLGSCIARQCSYREALPIGENEEAYASRGLTFCKQNVCTKPIKDSVDEYIYNIDDMMPPRKRSSCWVYCPEKIHQVGAFHESIDFYRNRQFDDLTFDSSLVYIKALLTSELVYRVKNNLNSIACKLSILSKRKLPPTFLTETIGGEVSTWISKSLLDDVIPPNRFPLENLTPYSNTLVSPFLSRKDLLSINQQYSSLYFGLVDVRDNHYSNEIKKPFSSKTLKTTACDKDQIVSQCNTRVRLDFAAPTLLGTVGHEMGSMYAQHHQIDGYTFIDKRTPQIKQNNHQREVLCKREILLLLRKWMQVPQCYALHKGVVSLKKLPELLQIKERSSDSLSFLVTSGSDLDLGVSSNTRAVKISLLPHARKASKLLFNTRHCFHRFSFKPKVSGVGTLKIKSTSLRTFHLRENDKTERYKFLVWKNLINGNYFLKLRACPLQVQVVSNTKARYFLPVNN